MSAIAVKRVLDPPPIPKLIDDHLYRRLSKAVGSDRAFAAVDAAWLAIIELGLYKPEEES